MRVFLRNIIVYYNHYTMSEELCTFGEVSIQQILSSLDKPYSLESIQTYLLYNSNSLPCPHHFQSSVHQQSDLSKALDNMNGCHSRCH